MRHSEYWFAAIGLVLVAVLASRVLPRGRDAQAPVEPPVATTPSLGKVLKPKLELAAATAFAGADRNTGPISGQVVAEDASPIANAQIEAFNMQGRPLQALSDSNGAFTMPELPAPGGIYFRVKAPGFAVCPIDPVNGHVARDSSFEGIQLILERESTAAGVVLDASGNPAIGQTVDIGSRELPYSVYDSVTTDSNGAFTLRRLSAGEYYIRSEISGRMPFQIGRAETITGLELRAPADPIYISGVVTDMDGQPIGDAELYFDGVRITHLERDGFRFTHTKRDGLFSLPLSAMHVPTGSVVAKHDEYSDSEARLVESATLDLKLVLRPMASVAGRVVYAKTGKPVTKFRVRASSMYDFRGDEKFTRVEDLQGRFDQLLAKAGTTRVEVFIHDHPLAIATIAPLQAGEVRHGVVIQITPGTRFEGRVLDAAGEPVRLAHVAAKGFPAEMGFTDVTGDDGAFLLGPFADGTVELSVNAPGMKEESFSVTVSPAMPDLTLLNLKQEPRKPHRASRQRQ